MKRTVKFALFACLVLLASVFMFTSCDERPEWCLNTDGHIRSVIMGRSVTIPIIDGEIQLGEFGLVYFADWDQVRSRTRTVITQVMGI